MWKWMLCNRHYCDTWWFKFYFILRTNGNLKTSYLCPKLKFQFLKLYKETDALLSVIVGWNSEDFIIIENWLSGDLFDRIWPCLTSFIWLKLGWILNRLATNYPKEMTYTALKSTNMNYFAFPISETEKGFRIINTMKRSNTYSSAASTISSLILTNVVT